MFAGWPVGSKIGSEATVEIEASAIIGPRIHYGPVRWSESWLKLAENTVLVEMLGEKNIVPAEKKKPNKPDMR